MADSKLRPDYDSFPTSADVERAIPESPRHWRTALVVWEFVMLRAEMSGSPRPSRVVADPILIGVSRSRLMALELPTLAAVALIFGYLAVHGGLVGDVTWPLWAGFCIVMAAAVAQATRSWTGPRGQVIRLIRDARDLPSDERVVQLVEAVKLDAQGDADDD